MVRFKHRHRPVRYITNRMRVLRAERRWSQTDLAKRMGYLSKYRIWELENEKGEPTTEERRKLAKLFRCPATYIFPAPKALAS